MRAACWVMTAGSLGLASLHASVGCTEQRHVPPSDGPLDAVDVSVRSAEVGSARVVTTTLPPAGSSATGLSREEQVRRMAIRRAGVKPTTPDCLALYAGGVAGRGPDSKVEVRVEEFERFLTDLKRAMAAHDAEAVASMVRFPVFTKFGRTDKSKFVSRYAEIVTPCIEKTMACEIMDEVGENWEAIWLGYGHIKADSNSPGTDPAFFITSFSGRGACTP